MKESFIGGMLVLAVVVPLLIFLAVTLWKPLSEAFGSLLAVGLILLIFGSLFEKLRLWR
jgi:cell division protein FtsW (lipid II flippase)